MAKKVFRKGKKFSKLILSLALFLFILLAANLVFAADVAYIYKSKTKIDKNVLSVFSEMNLSVDTISEKNTGANLSNYKLVYYGNERFSNYNKIPAYNYPSVVTNYYFGYQWGLTDNDGVSKLASTDALSVVKNGQIIQVYTQAKYDGRSISIPYFYLGELNKVPNMQKVAGTYYGNNQNLGDVISFASAGTHLINGKSAKGNICFFGIVESKYWTPEARQLFKDCVGMISVTCSNDSQCGVDAIGQNYCTNEKVYQDITHYSCQNPGTVQSKCVSNVINKNIQNCTTNQTCQNGLCLNINCKQDSECGINGFIPNSDICQNNNVFANYISFKCNNPNTANSSCTSNVSLILKETCQVFCINNQCNNGNHDVSMIDFSGSVNKIKVTDYINESIVYLDNPIILTCNQKYKFFIKLKNSGDFTENISYSGSINGLAINHDSTANLAPNATTSEKSKTVNITLPAGNYNLTISSIINNDKNLLDNIATRTVQVNCPNCTSDSQCGDDHYSNNYCIGNNVYHDLHHPNCLNNNCADSINPVLVTQCSQSCNNGICVNIICSNNAQCGINGFTGNPFCQNNDVFQNYITFTCNYPGTTQSFCSNSTIIQLKTDCINAEICNNGYCTGNVICSNNSQCNDNNLYTYDQCNNPGTANSYCSHTLVNCVTNNDCGLTGFIGNEFCSGNNVFKYFLNSSCINSGTVMSYCEIFQTPKILTTCGNGICSNGTCIASTCVDNDQDTYDSCNPAQPGDDGKPLDCNDNNANVHPNAIEICNGIDDDCDGLIDENNGNCGQGQICTNGQCSNIACSNNAQCGINGFTGNPFCITGDVFQNYITFTCNNPGTVNSYCSNNTNSQLKTDCPNGQICSNGACVNIVCSNNAQCGTDGFIGNAFCQSNNVFQNYITYTCNNPGTAQSTCSSSSNSQLKQTCTYGCTNGTCIASTCVDNDQDTYDSCNPAQPGDDGKPLDCNDNNANVHPNAIEICNGIDDDCDGLIDENNGNCGQGQICTNGQCSNIACSNDAQCSDNNPYTYDQCNNPGTISSFCTHLPILCLNSNDCGTNGFINGLFCQNNDVFQSFITYTCNNPGTIQSSCSSSTAPQLKTDCTTGQICNNGACITITCSNDAQCNDNNQYTIDKCLNPGTAQSSCTHSPINCLTNSDCGTNGFINGLFCQNNNVFQNFITYTCNNPGTEYSSCSNSIAPQQKQACAQNQICSNGNCVSITCSNDSQCNDNNQYTEDKCINPGTAQSSCTHLPINCIMNSDCGTNGFINGLFCQNNDVFQSFITYTCNNPGTSNSFCSSSTAPQLKTDCTTGQVCSNGNCINIICSNDSQCNDGNAHTYDQCINPGTAQSSCSHTPITCLNDFECNDGNPNTFDQCLNPGTVQSSCTYTAIVCFNNLQCGTNTFIGSPFCQSNNIFQNFITYTCINPGTIQSSCSSSSSPQLKQTCPYGCTNGACIVSNCVDNDQDTYDSCNPGQPGDDGKPLDCNDNNFNVHPNALEICNGIDDDCDGLIDENNGNCGQGQICTNGQCFNVACSNDAQCNDNNQYTEDKCINPGTISSFCTHLPILCLNSNDCGTNGFFNGLFCQNTDVFQNFITYTCNNPGTSNSFCTNSIAPQLKIDCPAGQICNNGACITITCSNDSQCNDNNQYTVDKCLNPGTAQSSCTHSPINCLTNSDCGTNGFFNGLFCQNNNVFQNFITYTCNNPGTEYSSCSNSIAPQQKQACAQNQICSNGNCVSITCSNDSQCNDNNQYTEDKCINPGTAQSSCTHLPINCLTNSDCGTNGFINGLFCQNNDVFQSFITYICNNPGTSNSFCTNSIAPQLKTDCTTGQVCSNGNCINVICSNDSQCNDGNAHTYDQCINPGTAQSSCSHTPITCLNDSECNDANQNTLDRCLNPGTVQSSCTYTAIVCFNNAQCGTNGFINGLFCQNNNVFQNFITYTCNNPGTIQSSCSSSSSPLLNKTCQFGCTNGACTTSNCVDNDQDTYDSCNPGQPGDDGKPLDCNDNNANVHPNAIEICNGIDDDCDGQIDEGGICTLCGYGQAANAPSPHACDTSNWTIGHPSDKICKNNIYVPTWEITAGTPVDQVTGYKARLTRDLITLNKFCREYTKDPNSYAVSALVHSYCGGCNFNVNWNGANWVYDSCVLPGNFNVQEVYCGTDCTDQCTNPTTIPRIGKKTYIVNG